MSNVRRAKAVWNRGLQFVGTSGSGHGIVIDAATDEGGFAAGPSNTELLLIALSGCTGMDVLSILRKKKLTIDDFEVTAEGRLTSEDPEQEYPRYVSHIHLTYRVWGPDIAESAVEHAIELSQRHYCTISNTLRGRTEITYQHAINPTD